MNKKVQDVTPPRRSIHDIPVPKGKGKGRNPASNSGLTKKEKMSFWRKMIITIFFGVTALFLFNFLASSSATISVVCRQLTKRTDSNFTAVSNNETRGIPFDVVRLDKVVVGAADATGEEEVLDKAKGEIIIFNNFSSENQRLIKNTRFKTPEGLIFRIQNSVIVPGQEVNSSGELIPGSIEVTVYSDQAGEKYNIGLKDFTIPGFEGTERYDKFYARSKTTMGGGFKGVKKIASESDIENIQVELSEKSIAELTEQIKAQVPEGFILYQDAIFSKSKFLGTKDLGEKVGVEVKSNVYGIIFNKNNLSKYIAESIIEDYDGSELIISNLKSLDFEIKNKEDVVPWVEGRFVFSLKGECNFEWTFDEDALKNDLVGRAKSDIGEILSLYPSIDSAGVTSKPFWKNSFPRNTGNIKIIKDSSF